MKKILFFIMLTFVLAFVACDDMAKELVDIQQSIDDGTANTANSTNAVNTNAATNATNTNSVNNTTTPNTWDSAVWDQSTWGD